MKTVVVVGGSIAAVRTVEGLRTEGFDGRIVLVSAETHWPYDRPPLSKGVLGGDAGTTLLDAAAAEHLRLEIRLGVAATGLRGRTLSLADGSTLDFDDCVIATGAAALPSPWKLASGVHTLRTLDDGLRLRDELGAGGHIVAIGAGFIGAEVAASARKRGLAVTMLDAETEPLARIFQRQVTAQLQALHARNGVTTRFGTRVARLEGSAGDLAVVLEGGARIEATAVVVGIGARPAVGWLAGADVELAGGVLADEHGRVRDGVWAAGDVARWRDPGTGQHRSAEHWTSAVEQASVVAHNIVHPAEPRAHRPVPYVWSDQHGWRIQVLGRTRDLPCVEIGEGDRRAFLYGAGTLEGIVAVSWPRAIIRGRRLLGGALDAAASALANRDNVAG